MQVTLGLTEIFTRIGCHNNNPIISSFLNITYEAKLITITTENPPEKKSYLNGHPKRPRKSHLLRFKKTPENHTFLRFLKKQKIIPKIPTHK